MFVFACPHTMQKIKTMCVPAPLGSDDCAFRRVHVQRYDHEVMIDCASRSGGPTAVATIHSQLQVELGQGSRGWRENNIHHLSPSGADNIHHLSGDSGDPWCPPDANVDRLDRRGTIHIDVGS